MSPGLNRDTAVGVVGAVVLIAAMAGVFFYERAQFEEYDVAWEEIEAGSSSETDSLDEGASQSYTFTADADRLSRVTLTLSWSGDVGEADTFELVAEGPNGTHTGSVEGSASPLEVEIPIHEDPGVETATGRSLDDAREQLNTSASWTNGTGDWSVTVTLVDAPGQQVGGQEAMGDGSQDYELAFTFERWEPSLTPT